MRHILSLTAMATLLVLVGCDQANPDDQGGLETPSMKMEAYGASQTASSMSTSSVLTYNDPPLVAGEDRLGTTLEAFSIGDPARWSYYRFCGTAGQIVTLTVRRTTPGFDPAFSFFAGESDSTVGLSSNASTNPDLTFLAFADDELPSEVPGPFGDPQLADYELPVTGTYTIGLFDFGGSGAVPYGYRVESHGHSCEGDEVIDISESLDIMPGSDTNPINLRSRGVIPVALYGSTGFDVGDIDLQTITFAGAEPDRAPRLVDVDGDGHLDLMMHFRRDATNIAPGDTEACLSAQGTDGSSTFHGCDSITIVP